MDKYLADLFSEVINIQIFCKYINCIKKFYFIYYRYNLLPFFLFRILLNKKSFTMIFWTEYFRSPACRLPLRWIYDFYSKTHLKLESSRMCSELCRHINNSCDYPRKQDTTINHIRMQKIESFEICLLQLKEIHMKDFILHFIHIFPFEQTVLRHL